MESDILNIAVIGVGSMGFNHVRVMQDFDDINVIAICDLDGDKLKKVGHRFKINNLYNEVSALLKNHKIDGVIISTPSVMHYSVAKMVLDFNIPLLIEKPIAATTENALELIDLGKKKNVPLLVGYVERFNPVVKQIKSILEKTSPGNLQHINICRVNSFPARVQSRNEGVVLDLSTHDIDLVTFLTHSKIKKVLAMTRKENNCDVYARALFQLENDITASCEWSWISPQRKRTIEIIEKNGALIGDLSEQKLYFYKNASVEKINNLEPNFLSMTRFFPLEEEVRKFAVPKEEPLKAELRNFIEVIRSGMQVDAMYSLEALRVMEAIFESIHQQRYVTVQ